MVVGIRGGSVQGDAIRVCRLDALGAPLWGAESCIQTDNIVKLDFSPEVQAGADITTVDAQGRSCLSWRGRDTTKRSNITLDICDLDLLMLELLLGGTLFEDANVRTTAGDAHTTSGDATITSASANFDSGDVGAAITGTGIPVSSTIISVTNESTIEISSNATATGTTVALTITPVPEIVGYQSVHAGEIGCPNGASIEVWTKRVIHDAQVGWWHWLYARNYLSETAKSIANEAMAVSLAGYGTENPNFGSGPFHDFNQDSSSLWQVVAVDALPSPLADGYVTITA